MHYLDLMIITQIINMHKNYFYNIYANIFSFFFLVTLTLLQDLFLTKLTIENIIIN